MALTRKDKPDWFALTDRVRAIFELEIATRADLARFLNVHVQRVGEWIQHVREPKANITIRIDEWQQNILTTEIVPNERVVEYTKLVKSFGKQNT